MQILKNRSRGGYANIRQNKFKPKTVTRDTKESAISTPKPPNKNKPRTRGFTDEFCQTIKHWRTGSGSLRGVRWRGLPNLRRRNTNSLQSLPRDTSGGRGPAHPARPAGPAARHTRGDCGPARLVKLVRNPRRSTRKPSVTACWEGCVPCPRDACSWDARVVRHRKNQRDSPQQQNE